MAQRAITAGVAGTGFIGAVHAEALRRIGVEVAGVVGSSEERALAAGIGPAYPSYEALLADDAIDVVHLATPNHLHAAQASAALAAGKHVVCEKPLGVSSAETGALLAAARASGLVHATNLNLRFYPQVHEARALVASGAIGEVRLVSGGYLQDWLLYDTDWNWRLDPALGGPLRAIADIGLHWLDMVSFVTGQRIVEVMADLATFIRVRQQPTGPVATFSAGGGQTRPREIASEDAATVLVRLANGARGALTVSQVSAGRKNHLAWEVDGAEAALAWQSERPEELWIGHRGRPSEIALRDPALLHDSARAITRHPGGHAEGFPDTFAALYRAVYRDVAAGRPSPAPDYPTFADGHRGQLVCEAVAASAREGRFVAVAAEEEA
jgi:predicted dehydrogenase